MSLKILFYRRYQIYEVIVKNWGLMMVGQTAGIDSRACAAVLLNKAPRVE